MFLIPVWQKSRDANKFYQKSAILHLILMIKDTMVGLAFVWTEKSIYFVISW